MRDMVVLSALRAQRKEPPGQPEPPAVTSGYFSEVMDRDERGLILLIVT